MPRINSIGFDELLDQLHAQARNTPKIMERMLEAAGNVYIDKTVEQIIAMNIVDRGTTRDGIKKRMVGKRRDGYRMEVWPSGTRVDKEHPKGERVETVAFIANYGTKAINPRPWAETSAALAAEPAVEAMQRVLEEASKV